MKKHGWKIVLGVGLVLLSAILYGVHYLLFEDWHHIEIYLLGDIAFVPLEVLLVTLILHQLLDWRERHAKMQKLNMAIGVFFGEMGADLLGEMRRIESSGAADDEAFHVAADWEDARFRSAGTAASGMSGLAFETDAKQLASLRGFLAGKRDFLLRLLENPNLLEHESFSDVLWAVFHLTDELEHRDDLGALPETDRKHLAGDMERVYKRLLVQWLAYMRHLKTNYPYLFSLAVRTTPFAETKEPVVRA